MVLVGLDKIIINFKKCQWHGDGPATRAKWWEIRTEQQRQKKWHHIERAGRDKEGREGKGGGERGRDDATYPTTLARLGRLVFVRHAVETVWRTTVGPVPGPIQPDVVLFCFFFQTTKSPGHKKSEKKKRAFSSIFKNKKKHDVPRNRGIGFHGCRQGDRITSHQSVSQS